MPAIQKRILFRMVCCANLNTGFEYLKDQVLCCIFFSELVKSDFLSCPLSLEKLFGAESGRSSVSPSLLNLLNILLLISVDAMLEVYGFKFGVMTVGLFFWTFRRIKDGRWR
ncbi:hypothetical protein MA16_Dca011404 [Dendrobium catenatum]|uniref:Uncharacterized protein n=1 Tax=Dendrobium catenatum TaxID=906689 RepID=A0A2I0WP20_9ASPA|nr:hypothetical protein MA16_Dca011404 [Dendrobium catenatum]